MRSRPTDDARGEVLVAILNNYADFAILQEQHWYRIPVASAPKRWPPQVLAFWQTSVFAAEAFAVNYYGRVRGIQRVRRAELFPNEIVSARSEREYYQVHLESVERLPHPITSKPRRVLFISTTWDKFAQAAELNSIFDDSPVEDQLWDRLRQENIPAERQWEERDNERNNALAANGWSVLRFNGRQIHEDAARYCTAQIALMIVTCVDFWPTPPQAPPPSYGVIVLPVQAIVGLRHSPPQHLSIFPALRHTRSEPLPAPLPLSPFALFSRLAPHPPHPPLPNRPPARPKQQDLTGF